MRLRFTLWLVLTLPGLALASELNDPFPIRDPLPFKLLFLDQAPAGAHLQGKRRARLSWNTTYVNTMVATDGLVNLYNRDPSYGGIVTLGVLQAIAAAQPSGTAFILDAETLRTTVGARVGVAPRLELGIEVPFLSQGSGVMDTYIDDFHERFHFPDGGRVGFATGEFRAGYIGDGATVYFDRRPAGVRLGDIVLSATGALLVERDRLPALSLSLAAKLPTGDYRALDGSGSRDQGVALRLTKSRGRFTVHAGYALNSLGEWRLAPGVPLHNSRSLFAAGVFSASPRTSIIVQVLRTSGPFPFRTGNDLGKVAMELGAGFRRRLPRGFDLEWSLIENLDPFYNTPDIGAFFGLSYSLIAGPTDLAGPPEKQDNWLRIHGVETR